MYVRRPILFSLQTLLFNVAAKFLHNKIIGCLISLIHKYIRLNLRRKFITSGISCPTNEFFYVLF